jgi:hypothetical protein
LMKLTFRKWGVRNEGKKLPLEMIF